MEDLAAYLFSPFSSFLLGAVSSLFVWWLIPRCWKPEVTFSEELVEYVLDGDESFFQCAFENTGSRDIIDLEIQVRIGIKGYRGATGWAHHLVKSNASKVPLLSPGKQRRVKIFDTRDPIEFIDKPSKTIREAIESCHSLRDVLELGDDGEVRIHVFGFDSFSGVRKHFQSKKYCDWEIRKGTFRGLNVVKNNRFAKPNYSTTEG
ncbi:hypothetical protein AB1A64_16265 [Ruegeria sp. ANG10]|uniref:hypothetical protein n=1 Tax=Ruegeria sp. ANG10 TaxID=3042467 RepID=UPI003451304C